MEGDDCQPAFWPDQIFTFFQQVHQSAQFIVDLHAERLVYLRHIAVQFTFDLLLTECPQVRCGFKRTLCPPVYYRICKGLCVSHFTVFAEHLLKGLGCVSIKYIRCCQCICLVHPHIERTFESVTETACAFVKLMTTHPKIRQYPIYLRDAL